MFYYIDRLDIAETFHKTDNALENLKEWRSIEGHKVFASKIRFQIRLDDFRYFVLESIFQFRITTNCKVLYPKSLTCCFLGAHMIQNFVRAIRILSFKVTLQVQPFMKYKDFTIWLPRPCLISSQRKFKIQMEQSHGGKQILFYST